MTESVRNMPLMDRCTQIGLFLIFSSLHFLTSFQIVGTRQHHGREAWKDPALSEMLIGPIMPGSHLDGSVPCCPRTSVLLQNHDHTQLRRFLAS